MKGENMIKIINLLILLSFISSLNLKAQFNQNTSRSLFSDVKAYKIGDAVTILILEETQAENTAITKDSRSSTMGGEINAGLDNNSFKANADLSTSTGFSGSGQTTRRENIRSKISARVMKIDEVGNLYVEGKRTTKINGEEQTIIISGTVRPVDILPNNSVLSYNILDLTLTIEGDGSVSKIQEPGLITKFLRILF